MTGDVGGQAAWSGDIENYTGYQFISGPELAVKFKEHLEKFDFDLQEGKAVKKVGMLGGIFNVSTADGLELQAKTLVIASGKRTRPLNVPGETEFKNKGITYCATCDGPLFAGKDVVVIGGGNSALDAALQMMKIATRVYLVNLNDKLAGDRVMMDKVKAAKNVEILNKTKTLEIFGDKFVQGMMVETDGTKKELKIQGIFVEIGLVPNSDFIDIVKKNRIGEIEINCAAETSVPGIFAAGDVTSVQEKQIIIAAGEGAKASLGAFKYLVTR